MVVVRATRIAARQVAGEALVFPLAQSAAEVGCVYTFEGIGGFIWDRLAEPQTVDGLVEAVVDAFQVLAEQAAPDVEAFIGDLRQARLVSVVSDAE